MQGFILFTYCLFCLYVRNNHRNTSSVSDIIDTLEWKSLEEGRREARLSMMFKITNDLVAIRKEGRLTQPTRFSRNMHEKSFVIQSCSPY